MSQSATRIERDTFGPIEVPADRLWGAQTQRSLEHFRISTEKMPAALIRAMLIVKRSAARVNVGPGHPCRPKSPMPSSPPPTKRSRARTPPSFRWRSGRPDPARRPT